jgi:hypothetical protein
MFWLDAMPLVIIFIFLFHLVLVHVKAIKIRKDPWRQKQKPTRILNPNKNGGYNGGSL